MKKAELKPLSNPEIYRRAIEIQAIGNIAVHKAQEQNRQLGIPNYYSINGRVICDTSEIEQHERNSPTA